MRRNVDTWNRRGLLGAGLSGAALLALPGCVGAAPTLSMTEVIRRLLLRASESAFARLTAPDGYWDDQVAAIQLQRQQLLQLRHHAVQPLDGVLHLLDHLQP